MESKKNILKMVNTELKEIIEKIKEQISSLKKFQKNLDRNDPYSRATSMSITSLEMSVMQLYIPTIIPNNS